MIKFTDINDNKLKDIINYNITIKDPVTNNISFKRTGPQIAEQIFKLLMKIHLQRAKQVILLIINCG